MVLFLYFVVSFQVCMVFLRYAVTQNIHVGTYRYIVICVLAVLSDSVVTARTGTDFILHFTF